MLAAAALPSPHQLSLLQIKAINQEEQEATWSEELPVQIGDDSSIIRHEPRIDTVNGRISRVLGDSKGQEYHLTVAEEDLKNIAGANMVIQTRYLETRDGTVIAVRDYSQYVQPTSQVSRLADEIYENAGDDYEFIYEVWYIVAHSTKYAHEDVENVSFPLETLFNSRGDCEDMTILMASIVGASSYTKDWDIKIAYFDASNPDDSNAVNHVALFIQTDQFRTFVESTNPELNGLSVWNRVDGWYIDVNHV